MNEQFINLLGEAFEDIGTLTSEKAMKLTEGGTALLKGLKEKLATGDAKAKEEARREAVQIQQWLISQMERLSEKTGLSLDDLTRLTQNPAFDPLEETGKLGSRMAPSTPAKHRKNKVIFS